MLKVELNLMKNLIYNRIFILRFSSFIIIFILFSFYQSISKAELNICSLIFSDVSRIKESTLVMNRWPVEYTRIPFEFLTGSSFNKYLIAKNLNHPNSIYVGFTLRQDGHVFIVAGDYRFDGGIYYIRPSEISKSDLISEGFTVRIESSKVNLRVQLENYFEELYLNEKKMKSFSCVKAAKSTLSRFEILNNNIKEVGRTFSPDQMILNIINDNFIDPDLDIEFYMVGNKDLTQIYTQLRRNWNPIYKIQLLLPESFQNFLEPK